MPFHPAPALPSRFAALLPWPRRIYELERGAQAGQELHLVDHGPRDGLPIVLLHGNATWSFGWRNVIAGLREQRCIAPDLLGFGLSGRLTAAAHTLDRHADSLAELLEALDLGSFILVGHDAGGPIAAAVGARLSHRVRGLVLSNTHALLPEARQRSSASWMSRLTAIGETALEHTWVPSSLLWALQDKPPSVRGPVGAAYRWTLRTAEDRVGFFALARMMPSGPAHRDFAAWKRAETWLRDLEGPRALVWSRLGPAAAALPEHQRALPSAVLTLCDAGHWIQEEVPEVFAAAIRRMAQRTTPACARHPL